MAPRDEQPSHDSADTEGTTAAQQPEYEPDQDVDHDSAGASDRVTDRATEDENEREPSPDFPRVPGRDVGLGGTYDVDAPPNTPGHTPEVPEPPD